MQGEGKRKEGKKKEKRWEGKEREERKEKTEKREKKDCFLNWATDYLGALEQVI